jgi:predicted nucleic acid-binding protein
MTIGVGEKIFLDTNILVFSAATRAPLYQAARRAIQDQHAAGAEIWISRQVLREYLATLSRPQTFSNPQPPDVLAADIRSFISQFFIAEETVQVTERLLDLIQQFPTGGKQIHDANIVATMLAYGIPTLLTNNTDDFVRFAGIITVLPLEANVS